MGQGATGEPNCWGESGRRGEHKKKPIVAQGATGEHKEKPGWGIRKSHVSIRKSPVRIRKSPVRIRAETVSIRKSREHKGRDPQHKKKYHALYDYRHKENTSKSKRGLARGTRESVMAAEVFHGIG